jgi:hypothetical protein
MGCAMTLNSDTAKWYTGAFIAASVLALSGAGFFAYLVWESHASRIWPHAPGTVIASYSERTCGGYRTIHIWEAKIVYRYRVNGLTHEAARVGGQRIYCDSNRGTVDSWLQTHYPVGKAVDVFYNASRPDSAFLHPGHIAGIDIVMICALLVMSGLMAVGGRIALRLQARGPASPAISGTPSRRRTAHFTFKVSVGGKRRK